MRPKHTVNPVGELGGIRPTTSCMQWLLPNKIQLFADATASVACGALSDRFIALSWPTSQSVTSIGGDTGPQVLFGGVGLNGLEILVAVSRALGNVQTRFNSLMERLNYVNWFRPT